jgi:hypothetical protein
MQARYITVGDVVKVGHRFLLVQKVEFKNGRVFVGGHNTDDRVKHTATFRPEEEVECE